MDFGIVNNIKEKRKKKRNTVGNTFALNPLSFKREYKSE